MYFRPFGFVLVHLTNSNVTFSLFVNIAFHGGKKCPNRTRRVNWNYFLISNFSLSASIQVHLLLTNFNGCQWVLLKDEILYTLIWQHVRFRTPVMCTWDFARSQLPYRKTRVEKPTSQYCTKNAFLTLSF